MSALVSKKGKCPSITAGLHFYGVDKEHAKAVKKRTGILIRHYWQSQGSVSVEELAMSAYIQGMLDGKEIDFAKNSC